MTYRFKYLQQERQLVGGTKFGPYIPLILKGREHNQEAFFLLDSGADYTLITKSLAQRLGVQEKETKEIGVASGEKATVGVGTIDVELRFVHQETKTLNLHCFIVDNDKAPLLLGRQGFFENFDITIKENQREVLLKPIENKRY